MFQFCQLSKTSYRNNNNLNLGNKHNIFKYFIINCQMDFVQIKSIDEYSAQSQEISVRTTPFTERNFADFVYSTLKNKKNTLQMKQQSLHFKSIDVNRHQSLHVYFPYSRYCAEHSVNVVQIMHGKFEQIPFVQSPQFFFIFYMETVWDKSGEVDDLMNKTEKEHKSTSHKTSQVSELETHQNIFE